MYNAGEHTRSELKTLRDAVNLTLSGIFMSFFMLKVSCFSKRIGEWGGTHRLQIGKETSGFLERGSMAPKWENTQEPWVFLGTSFYGV